MACRVSEDGKEVSINLQKENQMEWWKAVIVGDPEIDTTKVSASIAPPNGSVASEPSLTGPHCYRCSRRTQSLGTSMRRPARPLRR